MKRKAYRCYNYINKTIFECTNVRVDEKFRVQERILDYNSNEEVDHRTNHGIGEIFVDNNNDL